MSARLWLVSLSLCAVALAGCEEGTVGLETAAPKTVTLPNVVPADASTKPVAEAEVHRPTKVPDRIVLTWTGDPARTQAVTWRTDSSVAIGLAEIAVAGDDASFAKRARQLKAKTESLKSNLSTAHYHSAEFSALSPKTK